MKRIACLLLLLLATAAHGEEWTWGDAGPSQPESGEDSFIPSRNPRILEPEPQDGDSLAIGELGINGALSPEEIRALEIILAEAEAAEESSDPQASIAVSTDGVDDLEVVDGVVLAGGDRQARFLGIRKTLCSYGVMTCEDNLKPPRRHISDKPLRVPPPPPPPPAKFRPKPGFPPRPYPATTEAPSAFQGIIDALQPLIPSFGQEKVPKPKPFPHPHGKPIPPTFGERFQNVPIQGSFHSQSTNNFAVHQQHKPNFNVPSAPLPIPTHHVQQAPKPAHINHHVVQPTTVVEHHHKHTTLYQVNGAAPYTPPVYQGQAQTVHAVVTSQRDSSQRVHSIRDDQDEFVFGKDSDDLAGSSSDVHFSGSKAQSPGVRFESSSTRQQQQQSSSQGFSQGTVQTVQHGSTVRFGGSSATPQTIQQGSRVRFGNSEATQQANAQRFAQGSTVTLHHGASNVRQNSGVRFGTTSGAQQVTSQGSVQRVPLISTSVSSSVSSSVGTPGIPPVNTQRFQQATSQGHFQTQVQGQHHSFNGLDTTQQQQVLASVQDAVSANAIDPNFRPGKLEHGGFRPLSLLGNPLYREQQPAYREDCQCVPVNFCSDQDVVARSAPEDFRQLLDARTKKTSILSTRSDAPKTAENEDEVVVKTASSARRGKVLAFPPVVPETSGETTEATTEMTTEDVLEEVTEVPEEVTEVPEEVTEEATEVTELPEEEVTEAVTESRVRRESDTNEEEEEESETEAPEVEVPVASGRREGRQLTGFTPGGNGCGPNHVCCRRPVFKPRQQYTCGRRNAAGLLGRVKTVDFIKGTAEFAEYPWQAAILKRKEGQVVYQCGGALIDDRHVLTVAHCVQDIHPSEIKVRLGEWDVRSQTEFYAHVEMRASGVYAHPQYDATNLVNDLAVIRLEKVVDFTANPHITPVCLPDQFADFTHNMCQATGWGKDAFTSDSKFSPLLKEVELPVMESKQCEYSLQQARLGNTFSLHEGNICAGGEKDQDTCKGDGGGPLVCSGNDGSIQLAGLVSWGIGCGQSGVPGVYVKVSHYLDWIRAITRV